MHNFVKTAAAVMCLLPLFGCAKKVSIEEIDKSYSAGTVFVDAKIPQICGLSDNTLESEMNSRIERFVDGMLEEFEKAAGETGDKSEFSVKTDEYYNRDDFFSATCRIDAKARAKFPKSAQLAVNIDTRLCREVSLSELFSDEGYIDAINAQLENITETEREKYAGLWEKPRLMDNQGFFLKEDALVLYYPPYELSYYERGFVEFSVPLSEVEGYLKPEYRRLLPKTM